MKSIKDKRGGESNIHSWDIEIKGKVSKDQRALLNALLKQRRNKKWAPLVGIEWMDGMPLTLQMIETFYPHPKLKEILDDLVEKGYLVYEHPKQKVGNRRIPDEHLPKGYNIVTGKLSFEFNKILDPESYTPTLVSTDVSKLAIPNHDGIRQMTIREGLRLFGFPESYTITIPNTKAFDLLGNTVCIPVIKKVALQLLKSI